MIMDDSTRLLRPRRMVIIHRARGKMEITFSWVVEHLELR
jgi:hypothetical protein